MCMPEQGLARWVTKAERAGQPCPRAELGARGPSASTSTAGAFDTAGMAQVGLEHLTKIFPGPGGEGIRAVDDVCLVVEDRNCWCWSGRRAAAKPPLCA